ncbi:MAG: hypothetical protein WBA05_12100 [Gordonia sp. (in: high G+C Gram-positive bacteria)]|uniref:hypothetical protein n=1 Tax=Gordonia sp. (in: high G+C Gram-positive bacteria) TaxID=84139 RepID=UPI003C73DE07
MIGRPAAELEEPADRPSCADRFVALIAACRELGLTGVDDAAVREPHRAVDQFRHPTFADDARRLTDLADELWVAAGADLVSTAATENASVTEAQWSGRSSRSARSVLHVVGTEVTAAARGLRDGAAATAHAASVLETVLARHRRALETVSAPQLAGFDLDALPAALHSGAVHPPALRGEVQARLDYAAAAGTLAGEAITAALTEVADAWAGENASAGELVLADLR